jgi:hypothetical protein
VAHSVEVIRLGELPLSAHLRDSLEGDVQVADNLGHAKGATLVHRPKPRAAPPAEGLEEARLIQGRQHVFLTGNPPRR